MCRACAARRASTIDAGHGRTHGGSHAATRGTRRHAIVGLAVTIARLRRCSPIRPAARNA
ncbi:hypothetical protein C6P74_28025 [Burkholderia multivorans]|nr:hypothetical protein C6P74_28025 [Burkholderia multivorans]PRE74963.1 hypothetical protein C6Q02_29930 [Burkholderia multivorans]